MEWNKIYGECIFEVRVAALAILLVFALVMPVPIADAEEKSGHPKLEQKLYLLAESNDPEAFARNNGIELIDDRVRVLIDLSNTTNISARFDITIEEQDKNLVQALLPVSALLGIADEPDVNYIKVPEKYIPLKENPRQTSFPSVFSWAAVLVIYLLIKIRRRN